MRRAWIGAAALACALVGGPALAQDPPAEPPVEAPAETFTLNAVLVATFDAAQPFLQPEADRVRGLVEAALARQYVVLTPKDVPPFDDSTAEVYLRSCPDGQYIGCVFVVGGKAQTDWVLGGQVTAVDGGYKATLSFIDMSKSKLVMDVDVKLDGRNDAEFQEGVLKVMDALIRGDTQGLQTKTDPATQAREDEEREERERLQRQFSQDSTFEDPGRATPPPADPDVPATAPPPADGGRVSAKDLEAMEAQGGVPPWERAGLTRSQYRLYRNSGVKLDVFRDRMLGRKGQVLFRLSGGVGAGPWGTTHETWYLIAADANPARVAASDVLDQASTQMQARALSPQGTLEVDVGLTPWMELGVFGAARASTFSYRFARQIEGSDLDLEAPTATSRLSWQAGLKLGFIPLPAYPLRPTLHVGASYWQGSAITKVVQVPTFLASSQMKPNFGVFVHVQPGAEVSAGKWVLIFTRFDLDIPVLWRLGQTNVEPRGDARLSDRPPKESDNGFALGGSLGIAIRIPVGPERRGL